MKFLSPSMSTSTPVVLYIFLWWTSHEKIYCIFHLYHVPIPIVLLDLTVQHTMGRKVSTGSKIKWFYNYWKISGICKLAGIEALPIFNFPVHYISHVTNTSHLNIHFYYQFIYVIYRQKCFVCKGQASSLFWPYWITIERLWWEIIEMKNMSDQVTDFYSHYFFQWYPYPSEKTETSYHMYFCHWLLVKV